MEKSSSKEASVMKCLTHKIFVKFEAISSEPFALLLEYCVYSFKLFGSEHELHSSDKFPEFLDAFSVALSEDFFPKIVQNVVSELRFLHHKAINFLNFIQVNQV